MNHNATIIYETKDVTEDSTEIRRKRLVDNKVIAGKMAGICYMPDNYLSDGIQNDEKALKRAEGTAKSGHYSTYEHSHITFLIETNKMMAMVLNSMNLYSTSEKSARYTSMNPETNLEKEYYEKWQKIFEKLIAAYNRDEVLYNEKEIQKLAMENARYMISVFTPTVLAYTVPFNRAILMINWMNDLANRLSKRLENISDTDLAKKNFVNNTVSSLRELSNSMKQQLGFDDKEDILLDDHKNIGIEFFTKEYVDARLNSINIIPKDNESIYTKRSYFGDVYVDTYMVSFAALAQEHRHRTLHYQFNILGDNFTCYIPKIIKNTPYEDEWKKDYQNLINIGVVPQGTIVFATEEGRFEDWVLKCKERLCSRAQLEIEEITRDQVKKFVKSSNNLCYVNRAVLSDMIDTDINNKDVIKVKSRCRLCDYTCKEPCKQMNDNILYNRIV